MPKALAVRFSPAIGAPPAPAITTSGANIMITSSQEADHPCTSSARPAHVSPTVQIELRSVRVSQWNALPSFSTTFRSRKGREPSCWTPRTSEAESKLRQELESYGCLDDNWDGDGAKAPSQEAVNDALTFLDGRPADIPLPYPEHSTEGDVGVYWDDSHAQVFAEVTFEGDGTFAYFAVNGVPGAIDVKCGDDDVDVAGPWPDDMLRVLRIPDST